MTARLLSAGLVVALALSGVVWLHGYREHRACSPPWCDLKHGTKLAKPGWADPVSVGVGVAALTVAVVLVVGRRRV